ncbi:MAG: hypothetical protein AAF225_07895 [Pseudomonadota bacterium]
MRRKDRLGEFAFGRIIEAVIQTLNHRTARTELLTKLKVKLAVAGKTLQIIKNDNKGLIGMLIEIVQQGDQAGTFEIVTAARNIIREDRLNRITLENCVLAATLFLAFETRSLCLLLWCADPAVDECLRRLYREFAYCFH